MSAVRFFLALLCAFVMSGAFAQTTQCFDYTITVTDAAGTRVYKTQSPTSTCQAFISGEVTRVITETGSGATYYKMEDKGTFESATENMCIYTRVRTTTSGTTVSSTTTNGVSRSMSKTGATCQPSCPAQGATVGTSSTVWYATRQAAAGSLAFCNNGCLFSGAMAGQDASGTYFGGPAVASGGSCSDAAASPGTVPSQAPPGKCPGTVNGTTVYVPCDKTWSAPATQNSTSTSTNGSTTSTSSTGTTTQTTCTAAVCTTTTTKTDTSSNGAGGTTTGTSSMPKSEYCAKNPGDPQCTDGNDDGADAPEEDPSTFGGSCGGGFQCSGDAVQCAMAREQHRRACELFERSTTQSQLGESSTTNGSGGGVDHPRRNVETIDFSSRIDQTDILGGSCPQDISVPMGSGLPPVVLAVSKICGPAQTLGPILVALTALACVGIVFLGRGNS